MVYVEYFDNTRPSSCEGQALRARVDASPPQAYLNPATGQAFASVPFDGPYQLRAQDLTLTATSGGAGALAPSSIFNVGDTYYVATSTIEWYPGVQIHASKDLQQWELVSRPLNRADLLDMRGVPDSCGVWAPGLSYADGEFWLVYTNVRRFDGDFKATPNFLTTCDTIDGDWGAPVYLNASGFDPSLFHDDDGRKWLVNMIWDHRADRTHFGGIYLQEYDVEARRLIGPRTNIFKGSPSGFTEAPHLYKVNGYYYLMTAEGGTGYDHAVTIARSKDIQGPYELDHELCSAAHQLHLFAARNARQSLDEMRQLRHDAVPPGGVGQSKCLHQLRPSYGHHTPRQVYRAL